MGVLLAEAMEGKDEEETRKESGRMEELVLRKLLRLDSDRDVSNL